MTSLPEPQDLERLTMRAVVAYAARTARRASQEFRGVVDDEVLDHLLSMVDCVSTVAAVNELDSALLSEAGASIAKAFRAAPARARTPERTRLLFCLAQAALAAMHTIEGAKSPEWSRHQMKLAAKAAHRAVFAVQNLGGRFAASAAAAKRDYEILNRKYGDHEDVVIGAPIDCFDVDAMRNGFDE